MTGKQNVLHTKQQHGTNLYGFDLLKVLNPPDLESGCVEGVASDEVLCVARQAVDLAKLLSAGEKPEKSKNI